MTIPAISTVYSDGEAIRRQLGELGYEQQVDDIDALEQDGVLDRYIEGASDTVNFWCGRHYAPAQLVLSRKVWDWCGIITIYNLMSRQAAAPPFIVQKAYLDAIAEMKMVSNGWPLPGIFKTTKSAPIVHTHESNPHSPRKTSPVIAEESLDQSGKMRPTPRLLEVFVPFDWE